MVWHGMACASNVTEQNRTGGGFFFRITEYISKSDLGLMSTKVLVEVCGI